MTTTTAEPIHYVIYQSHLGDVSDEQASGYAGNVEAAIRAAYPGREVEVEVLQRVSGVGSGLQGEPEGVDENQIRRLAEQAEIPAHTGPLYYETTITPSSGGFGEYDQQPPNSEGRFDETDLINEMLSNEPDLIELGVDPLPEGVEDIRGRIHNQSGRIFALPGDDDHSTRYFAVVERK